MKRRKKKGRKDEDEILSETNESLKLKDKIKKTLLEKLMPAKLLGGSMKQPKVAQHLEESKETEKINRRGVLSQRKNEIVKPPENSSKRDLSDPAKQDQDVALKQ